MRLLQCGTCPEPLKSSRFPSSSRLALVGFQASFVGWMVTAVSARQRSNGELNGGPDGEQLAGAGRKARSAQRWCSADLLRLLRGKLSPKVFISWQTRLCLDSYTALDLRISDKKLSAELTSAVEPGFFRSRTLSSLNISITRNPPGLRLKGVLRSLLLGSPLQHHLLERVRVYSHFQPLHVNSCSIM